MQRPDRRSSPRRTPPSATARWTASAAALRLAELLAECAALDAFRRASDNLYERVRALFFLYAIHRFHLPAQPGVPGAPALIPFDGYDHLLQRRFEEAIDVFLRGAARRRARATALSSALAAAYQRLGFQTLADQVAAACARCAATSGCSAWATRPTSRCASAASCCGAIRPTAPFPILRETHARCAWTSSHSGWSDIFFLGHGLPRGRAGAERLDRPRRARPRRRARGRRSRPTCASSTSRCCAWPASTSAPRPTSPAWPRSSTSPRTTSACSRPRSSPPASCRPGIEGSGQSLADLLARLVGPGRGLELVSNVNDIPKGSRLAVSTNLLAA